MARAFTVLLASVAIGAAGGVPGPSTATSDDGVAGSWTWTTAIGVSSASEVYVGLQMDSGGRVSRLSAAGERLGHWSTDGPMNDLGIGADGSVYTVMYRSGRGYRYAADGKPNGKWQASYFSNRIASGPLGGAADGSVYVLWTPQVIGQPPSGPPRITRYSAHGETLAEWEVSSRAYDLTVAVSDAAPEGIVHVAEAGGLISRYAPSGAPEGEWRTVTAEGRPVAAAPAALIYVAFSGELWRYDEAGAGSLACRLPAGEPRDIAVDPSRGEIYLLYPDSALRLSPDCSVLARFSYEQLIDEATDASGPHLYLPATLRTGRLPEVRVQGN